jgi:hypothetical protein
VDMRRSLSSVPLFLLWSVRWDGQHEIDIVKGA